MASYWWQCLSCKTTASFSELTNSKGIAHFIWDELYKTDWEQKLLEKKCPKCKSIMKITYEFPRKEKVVLHLNHIVGITSDDYFMQMLWETVEDDNLKKSLYDFKYINGRNIFGLNKAVVFTEQELNKIIQVFNSKCHKIV